MFSLPRAPKPSRNIGIYMYLRCFRNNPKSKCSQNTAICDTLATQQHVRNAVFWYLQCFVKTHALKDYTFHGNKPQKAKTLIFTAFLRNDFSKKRFFLDNFWLLKPPKTKEGGGTLPPPFHILNFKIFTKSKTWQFLELKTRPELHFFTVFTMFFARA